MRQDIPAQPTPETHLAGYMPATSILRKIGTTAPTAVRQVMDLSETIQNHLHDVENAGLARRRGAFLKNPIFWKAVAQSFSFVGMLAPFFATAAHPDAKTADPIGAWWRTGHCLRVAILTYMDRNHLTAAALRLTKQEEYDLGLHANLACHGTPVLQDIREQLGRPSAKAPAAKPA